MVKFVDPTKPVESAEATKKPRRVSKKEQEAQQLVETKSAELKEVIKAAPIKDLKGSSSLGGAPNNLEARMKADFRVFASVLWSFLGLSKSLTPVQGDIAKYLQWGGDRILIMAFRGAAKSYLTVAFVLWSLWKDPQLKIMVVSASLRRSASFVNFALSLIHQVPWLKSLRPQGRQRSSSLGFDVGPAIPADSPSLQAASITGQMTGFRGNIIIADDVEIPNNSATQVMREKIADAIKEFDALLLPGGRIIYLGTPQIEASLYNALPKKGYGVRIWPILYPNLAQRKAYGDKLAPMLREALDKHPGLAGSSTEPTRFDMEDIERRRLGWGAAGFALQFMLDTSLTDVAKHPLKLQDLVVLSLTPTRGPLDVIHSADPDRRLTDLPSLGLSGDYFYGPARQPDAFDEWEEVMMQIDPSGMGADETGAVILGYSNGYIGLLHSAGWQEGYAPSVLQDIADLVVKFRVKKVRVESNFGGGMFAQLLRPVIIATCARWNKSHPEHQVQCAVEDVTATRQQKELRIINVVEPVLASHRLIVDPNVILQDYEVVHKALEEGLAQEGAIGSEPDFEVNRRDRYSLFYQLTHLTRERDCLLHDDRLDALGSGVEYFVERMGINPKSGLKEREWQAMVDELDALMEDAMTLEENDPQPRPKTYQLGRRMNAVVHQREGVRHNVNTKAPGPNAR